MEEHIRAESNPPTPPLITFEGVDLGYGRRHVLTNVNLTIRAGDYVGIVGPNGAGKTTLLKGVLGVMRPERGRITRAAPRGHALRFGYVPQANTVDEVYPLSVMDVVLMGRYGRLGLMRRPGKTDREAACQALAKVGIADLAAGLYRDLSGGQRQRALVARALATEPDILILDEPTNDMDIAAERATMDLIDNLHREGGLTILMVSHILNMVVGHARQIAFLGADSISVLPVEEAATAEHLERLYGIPVTVREIAGRRVILP